METKMKSANVKKCPKCGKEMILRAGPYGTFYECSNKKCKKTISG